MTLPVDKLIHIIRGEILLARFALAAGQLGPKSKAVYELVIFIGRKGSW